MAQTPLFTALENDQKLNRMSFHMPGHKNHLELKKLSGMDTTEMAQTDSLYQSSGCILEAEKLAARLFSVEHTLFSAGGSTLCIQTMLRSVTRSGGKVLCGRTLHRSAVYAMMLLDLQPVFLYPDQSAGKAFPGRISPQQVEVALTQDDGIEAVYLTSPNYYGILQDVAAIAGVCKAHELPLLVDNAHGAHLQFVAGGLHPDQLGATMTANSGHKTLPVLTGGAWLNVKCGYDRRALKDNMALFGSTSPSYPIMASIDLCRSWLEQHGKRVFAKLLEQVDRVKETIRQQGLSMPEGLCDPVRLTLDTASIGMSGFLAGEYLRRWRIEPEYCDEASVVLIATPMNTEEEFEQLIQAIAALPRRDPMARAAPMNLPQLDTAMTLGEVKTAPWEYVEISAAAGRIAADVSCPCPPGVPVVMPGERIDRQAQQFLHRAGILRVKVIK